MNLQRIMEAGAQGVEITISGKIRGERARTVRFVSGAITKCGEPAKQVQKGLAVADLKQGMMGINVKIMPPDTRMPDYIDLEALKEKASPEPEVSEEAEESEVTESEVEESESEVTESESAVEDSGSEVEDSESEVKESESEVTESESEPAIPESDLTEPPPETAPETEPEPAVKEEVKTELKIEVTEVPAEEPIDETEKKSEEKAKEPGGK
jgi:small subunit ribosomal protein S3